MIRVATSDDVDTIARVEQESFGPGAWSRTLVADEIGSERHVVLVAGGGDGYGAISLAGDVADLDRIAVRPASRTRGIARALLGRLVDEAVLRGADRMLLEVAADNAAAIGLYASSGFTTISRRRGYYPDGVDALVMELAIPEHR